MKAKTLKYSEGRVHKSFNKKKRSNLKKLRGGNNNNVSHGSVCNIKKELKYKNVRRSKQGYLVICKKGKKIPLTKRRMYKTTLYSNNEGLSKKSKHLRKLHKKYDKCLKNTCWRRLSKTDLKKNIKEISKQLPNMFNNRNGCYINSLLQLLFQMEHYNNLIMNMDDSELQQLDTRYESKLLTYKKFLIARYNTIETNKKIDKFYSYLLLKELGHNNRQGDSSEILQTKLLGSIVDGNRDISKLFTTEYQMIKNKICEDGTIVPIEESQNKVFIELPISKEKSIIELINNFIKQKESESGRDTICKIKELSPPIIEQIRNFKRNNLETHFQESVYDYIKGIINGIDITVDNNTIKNYLNLLGNENIEQIYNILSSSRMPEEYRVEKDELFVKTNRMIEKTDLRIHEDQKYLFIRLLIYNMNLNKGIPEKKKSRVINLDENIEINNTQFRLLGFNAHIGGYGGGHYVSYVKKQNHWFFLDDTDPSPLGIHVDFEHYKTRCDPYILLYEKVTVTEPNSNSNSTFFLEI